MNSIKLSLQKEDIDQLSTIEQSIVHWSLELSRLLLQVDQLKETVSTLYQSKTDLLHGVSSRFDIPSARIRAYKVDYANGELHVGMDPEQPKP